jgi:type I restriction enzyme S subunit
VSWPLVAIKDFCQTGSGGTPSRKVAEYYNGDIPWIKSGDLRENVVTKASEFITELAVKKSSAKLVPKGAILLAMYGATVGRMAMLGIDAATNQAVCAIMPDPNRANARYVYYALLSKVPEFLRSAVGGAQPNISQGLIKDTKIPLPPLAEQKRIAAILDKADALRRKRQQAIDLADQFLRSVFLDMFGESACRSNWKKVLFSDVTLIDALMVDPREEEYLDLLHIGPDRIEKSTGRLLPALTARQERLISKKFLFDDSYVLYSKIRPYLRKVAMPDFVGLCSADMYPIKPAKGLMTKEFLWYLLLSDEFTKYTETLPGRANIPKLNRSELASFEFLLPPIEVQNKFSAIYAQLSRNVSNNDKGAEEVEQLFNSLSQRAFSGKL